MAIPYAKANDKLSRGNDDGTLNSALISVLGPLMFSDLKAIAFSNVTPPGTERVISVVQTGIPAAKPVPVETTAATTTTTTTTTA